MSSHSWKLIASLSLILILSTGAEASRRVLFLGDSFSKGAFGKTLDAQMRAAGLDVYTSVAGGASAYDWLPEFGTTSCDIGYWEKTPRSERRVSYIARIPKINELIAKYGPDVVVIQGGTNMYSVLTSKRRSHEANVAEFERLLTRIGEYCRASGAHLYWITPPSAHPQRFTPELQAEMRSILMRVAGKYGRVFNTYAVSRFTDPYPGTDGIHYGPTEAAAMARLVARDVVPFVGGRSPKRMAEESSSADRIAGEKSSRPESSRAEAPPEMRTNPRPGRRSFWDIFRRDQNKAREGVPPITIRRAELVRPGESRTSSPSSLSDVSSVLDVEVVLRQKSAVKTLNEVTYRSALGVFEYDVVRVRHGFYNYPRIRIAHLIVMNNRYTAINDRPLGSQMSLAVEPLSKYPNLEKVQTIDDLPEDYSLPVFVPKL
ncbi:MAG: SGNH/GDSL hydrolase family protein [Verrucomicrobiales bacterium]